MIKIEIKKTSASFIESVKKSKAAKKKRFAKYFEMIATKPKPNIPTN